MTPPVKRRPYDAEGRRAAAAARRRAVLEAAADLFATHGWSGTTMAEVARRAGVALDTVYALVGRKPALLLAVHDLLLGEGDLDADGEPLAALQRRYVAEVRAAPTARAKLDTYAAALGRVLPRTSPVLEALREAGTQDADCRAVWRGIEERRATNMLLLAADLRATGELRADLTDADVAELVWSMNGAAYFTAVCSRGRTPQEYTDRVADVWRRTLLADPG